MSKSTHVPSQLKPVVGKMQDPGWVASSSKLQASEFKHPTQDTKSQEPSFTLAMGSKLHAVKTVHPR